LLTDAFFARDACAVARDLVGAVLRRRIGGRWAAARIVETEAYYRTERASHSWLGRTPSREPMFGAPGTLYLYWSQGGDSLNVSVGEPGDAVLIKAAAPVVDARAPDSLELLHAGNPRRGGGRRPDHRVGAGQGLLCRALQLRVAEWSGERFDPDAFFAEAGDAPTVVQTRRIGIRADRDAHLPYRFVHADLARSATKNPLTARSLTEGADWWRVPPGQPVAPVHEGAA
jgi:DNA-3-methyladenine glycosylase